MLWEFSAYKVDELAIRDFEALIIRSFPNDLTNVRMETKGEKEVLSFDDDVWFYKKGLKNETCKTCNL